MWLCQCQSPPFPPVLSVPPPPSADCSPPTPQEEPVLPAREDLPRPGLGLADGAGRHQSDQRDRRGRDQADPVAQSSGHRPQRVHHEVCLSQSKIKHQIFIVRGCSPAGEASSSDDYIRIILWARETVRGAKVVGLICPRSFYNSHLYFSLKDAGDFVMAVCELSGQMLVYDHQKYLNIQEEEILMAMQKATTNQFRRLHEEAKMLFE